MEKIGKIGTVQQFSLKFDKPIVMGILNITPDSFYDGGAYLTDYKVLKRVEQIFTEGAEIIDIGAYSSRPGAQHISREEEWQRLQKVLKAIRQSSDFGKNAIISIDTFRSEIAQLAVNEYNANIINDISAGEADEKMMQTAAQLGVPYIMMHKQGTPQTMQQNPSYKDVVNEIISYFKQKIKKAKLLGIKDIAIDPGFGFGKTLQHNYQLLAHLHEFQIFKETLLVGISRKSMIYKLLETSPAEALNGTSVLNSIALQKGAQILRVHDVKEAMETIVLTQAVINYK